MQISLKDTYLKADDKRRSCELAKFDWPEGTRTQSFGFLLQQLARRNREDMSDRLEKVGLEFRFFPYLMFLLAKDGQSQRELGSHIADPEYQTSRNLDALGKAGLIERRPSPTSRRTTLVYLTKQGRKLAESLPGIIHEANDAFLETLSERERSQLEKIMQKLSEATG